MTNPFWTVWNKFVEISQLPFIDFLNELHLQLLLRRRTVQFLGQPHRKPLSGQIRKFRTDEILPDRPRKLVAVDGIRDHRVDQLDHQSEANGNEYPREDL